MTIRPLLSFLLALFLSSLSSLTYANHPWGSEITFRNTAKDKYTVQVISYRNCAAQAFGSTVDLVVANQSGTHQVKLKASRKSISDLSRTCKGQVSPCYPTNTGYTGNGVEQHIYEVEIDLSESAFDSIMASGEPILFEATNCCRNTAITNGSANLPMYNFALLDLQYGANSSPFIENKPQNFFGCNQPVYYNFQAVKELDGDSISYTFAHPREDYSTIINTRWPQVRVYYPGSLKYPYTNPNANPPIGLSFDSETGELVFTPVHCAELGNVVVELTAWRKDKNGNYQISSIMRRDQLFMTGHSPGNNPPVIENNPYFAACDTGEISFTINISDKVKKPPPPLSPPAPDTLSLRVLDTIEGAIYTVIKDTVPNKLKLHVKWQPRKKDLGKRYSVSFEVQDNACPRNAVTTRQIFIDLFKEIDGSIRSKDLGCNEVEVSYVPISSPGFRTHFHWQVYDSLGRELSSRLAYFPTSNSNTGNRETDTFYAVEGGTYFTKLTVFGNGYCSKEFYDTIHIKGAIKPLFSKDSILLCNTNSVTLKLDLYPISDFKGFAWGNHTTDSVYEFVYSQWGLFPFALRAEPKTGCFHFDRLDVVRSTEPRLSYYVPNGLCSPINYNLTVQVSPGFDRQSTIWNDSIYSDTLLVTSGATYDVEVHNLCGSVRDSITINEWYKPDFDLSVNGSVFCDFKSKVLQSGLKNRTPRPYYVWDQTSRDSSYKIVGFGKHELRVSNVCGSTSDSIEFTEMYNTPTVDFGNDTVVCHDNLITLSVTLPDGDIRWSNGYVIDNVRVSAPAKVWVDLTNKCGLASDTILLIREYPPRQEMTRDTFFCAPNSIILHAGNIGSAYEWQDNGWTGPKRAITKEGKYTVRVTNTCGSALYQAYVAKKELPVVELGRDTIYSSTTATTAELDAGNSGSTYLWSTGEKTQRITVNSWGKYWVEVTNECGTTRDVVRIGFSSIEELDRLGIRLYPNPSNGTIFLQSKDQDVLDNVTVYDVLGRTLKVTLNNTSNGLLEIQLPKINQVVFVQIAAQGKVISVPVMVIPD